MAFGDYFSQPVNDFRGIALPEPSTPVGYAGLMHRYDLAVPTPNRLAAVSVRHHPRNEGRWSLRPPSYLREDTLEAHLVFALRYEGVNLAVLAALFAVVAGDEFSRIVRASPTGSFARRIWFLYEWVTGKALDVTANEKVAAVRVVDPRLQIALLRGTPSRRHKVVDNLPGTAHFCPMVYRTPKIETFAGLHFDERARALLGPLRPDIVSRAAASLLLDDSKASFAIEGEQVSTDRASRWAQAIGQAGSRKLTLAELERMQRIIIGDARFVRLGLRQEGGFIGVHDRFTQEPVPEHISAKPEDLRGLIEGILAFEKRSLDGGIDPVVVAAVVGFGFVYAHPFIDGNGRVHRWLLHHVLATAKYNPPGLVFPVSSAILRSIDEYKKTLQSYSAAMLPYIHWRPTAARNVDVLNDTADFYRFFDATAHVEFLFDCVKQTLDIDLPDELAFLESFDLFSRRVKHIVEMPDPTIETLRGFLAQNAGKLSKRALTHEFAALTSLEVNAIEKLYADTFG